METMATPWTQIAGLEIDGKYPLGTCLAEGERQAVFQTTYQDSPAIIKIFRPGTSRAASDLLEGFTAAREFHHPNLLAVHDFGEVGEAGGTLLYVVTESADESLGNVLRERTLNEDEMRELLGGVIPALEYLHSRGYAHSRIRPANVFACGEMVKISSDRLRSLTRASDVVEPPGLHDAPETGAGHLSPAADVWSLAVLILEGITGSPLESSLDRLRSPFLEIVQGGLIRDPAKRWTLARIRRVLQPDVPIQVSSISSVLADQAEPETEDTRPRYRRLGVFAVGGALAAGVVCAFLIRGAHQTPAPAPVIVRAVAPRSTPPAPPVAAPHRDEFIPAGWAIVGAAYHRQADAEKRAAEIRRQHPALTADVQAADPGGHRFLVVFGTGLSASQAQRQLTAIRRAGGPRDAYITHFR